ncbi:MAG: hypothetical protein LUI06_02090 [Ruminococcus sp.]|nr:hypothetical protein [Ruminococcus sp.]
MTREEYKQEYLKLSRQRDIDYDEYEKQGGVIGLDGSPVNEKYKILEMELLERYKREKED